MNNYKKIVLTGDRPTGKLHLGHYVGSIKNRLAFQAEEVLQYIMIADVQALTDNFKQPEKIRENIIEVFMDYFAAGLDIKKNCIFLQSSIPQIAELTLYFLNLVTVNRLKRNPTIKNELKERAFGDSMPAGFLIYPVSQTADMTILGSELIPVGEDQLPIIEQANELIKSFNTIYNTTCLKQLTPIISATARLKGIDGKAKMSKSLNNAIYFSDTEAVLKEKIMQLYTDPKHIKITDPGAIEGNMVFEYLDAFDSNKEKVAALKAQYQKGGLGDVVLKNYCFEVLNEILTPMRKRRLEIEKNKNCIKEILYENNLRVAEIAEQTMKKVRSAMKFYFS